MSLPTDLPRIITRSELNTMIPYSLEHIRRMEKTGKFPKHISLGPHRVGWLLSDVEAWINDRTAKSVGASD